MRFVSCFVVTYFTITEVSSAGTPSGHFAVVVSAATTQGVFDCKDTYISIAVCI